MSQYRLFLLLVYNFTFILCFFKVIIVWRLSLLCHRPVGLLNLLLDIWKYWSFWIHSAWLSISKITSHVYFSGRQIQFNLNFVYLFINFHLFFLIIHCCKYVSSLTYNRATLWYLLLNQTSSHLHRTLHTFLSTLFPHILFLRRQSHLRCL